MRQLRVIVASPDEGLSSRTASVLANRGHIVVKRCATAIEAMEACFEESVDLAVVDDDLPSVSGSHIAQVLRELRSPVSAVVLCRGEGVLDRTMLTLDPARGGFEAALLNIADGVTPLQRTTPEDADPGSVSPGRAT